MHDCVETNWQKENTSGKKRKEGRHNGRQKGTRFLLEHIVRLVGVGDGDGVG